MLASGSYVPTLYQNRPAPQAVVINIQDFYQEHVPGIQKWLNDLQQNLHWMQDIEQANRIFYEMLQQILDRHDETLQIFWVSIDQGPNFNQLSLQRPYDLTCEDQGFFKKVFETLAYEVHLRLEDYNLHWNRNQKVIMKLNPYFMAIGVYDDF